MELAGKRVLITGASSGIGADLARQLAPLKAKLTLAARRTDRLEAIAAECRAKGAEATVVAADVADPEQCRAMVDAAVKAYGGLDLLVCNAGVSMWALFEDITDLTIFEKIMRVNYLGAVYATHYALPELKKSRGGILAVSSLTGKAGVPTRTAYAASKHALHGFFDSLRAELGPQLQITLACPSFVATEVREHAFAADGKPLKANPLDESKSMTSEECARQILAATRAGKRELVMTPIGKIGPWLKLVAPGLVDKVARRKVGLK